MTATAPLTRPRIAPHRPAAGATPVVPVYSDIVFAALMTLQAQLSDPDAAVARTAALGILDFEKTRMRHGCPVLGTQDGSAASETSGGVEDAPVGRGEEVEGVEGEGGDPEFDAYVEQVRADLERVKGQNGIPDVITRAFAERVARQTLDPDFRRRSGLPPNVGRRMPHQ